MATLIYLEVKSTVFEPCASPETASMASDLGTKKPLRGKPLKGWIAA
jgi:hypothetical protein